MTYGDAIADLRYALVDVLQVRRPEVEFEGHDVAAVADVTRYRDVVLRCARALAGSAIGDRLVRPVTALSAGLEYLLGQSGEQAPKRLTSDQLGTPHPIPVVEAWRRSAVAAVTLTERELPTIGALPHAMRLAVARDAGQVAVTVLRLDGRYATVDGWRTYVDDFGASKVREVWTAADQTRGWPYGDPFLESEGLVVDQLGYQPPPLSRQTPIGRVVDHLRASNDALRDRLPSVLVLRYLVKGHAVISAQVSRLAAAAGERMKTEDLRGRQGTYLGIGEEIANARSGKYPDDADLDNEARRRARDAAAGLDAIDRISGPELRQLTEVLDETDRIVSAVILRALRTNWFFEKNGEIGWYHDRAVKKPFSRWEPMHGSGHPDLVEKAKALDREHPALSPEPSAATERAWFAAEIERTETIAPSNAATLDRAHPRGLRRSLDQGVAPESFIITPDGVGGPGVFAALVHERKLDIVRGDVAVPAGTTITPELRAKALAPRIPSRSAIAGRAAAWVWTGVAWDGRLEVAFPHGRHQPDNLGDAEVWSVVNLGSSCIELGGVRVTSPERTGMDLAVRASPEDAHRMLLALADHGLDLTTVVRRLELRGRVVGRPRAREVLRRALDAIDGGEEALDDDDAAVSLGADRAAQTVADDYEMPVAVGTEAVGGPNL